MSKLSIFASAAVLSVAVAGSIVSPAYAWHPKGTITKSVQNVTAGGSLQAADSATTAVSAKPGDILNYVIEVKDTAAAADKHYNDLAFTVVTDNLPAGVEMVSNPSSRTFKQDFGTILPGSSRKVEFQVKVVSTTNGAVVTNKACFTADSVVKDNPQNGCDDAVIKVNVPPVVTPPVTTTPPATPVVTPQAPAVLLNTGMSEVFAPLVGLVTSVAGYLGYSARLKRRNA